MRWLGPALFLLSCAALSLEILLMRLMNIIQWHHFASMIISLALLGYGVSGTLVALFQRRWLSHFETLFTACAALFSLSAVGGFALSQRIAFNPLEILWDPGQFLRLGTVCLILFLPFFWAAMGICLSLARFRTFIPRLYRYDLAGAGAGAGLALGLLSITTPLAALRITAGLGLLAGAAPVLGEPRRRVRRMVVILGLGVLALACPQQWLILRISEYKGLSKALRIPEARILTERYSPLGWLAVVESTRVPFRYAPGLSLNFPWEPPPQLGVFIDGEGFTPVTRFTGDQQALAFLDGLPGTVAYQLLSRPSVLIPGAGGGMDILMALRNEARAVDAVELNGQILDLVGKTYAPFAGDIFGRDHVRAHRAEIRGFLARSSAKWDLIQISMLDSYQAAVAGTGALSPSYVYTVEGFGQYLRHLTPGGLLCVTRWLRIPPRDSLKLFSTALAALKGLGEAAPERHLAMIRTWKTATLLVKRNPWAAHELAAIRSFCEERSFDLVYCPDIEPGEVNRFNVLRTPIFHRGVMSLIKGDGFLDRYKYQIRPASDDQPYFFHFFRWQTLKEAWSLRGRGGFALIDWGYPVLAATVLQAAVLGFALVVVPLWVTRRRGKALPARAGGTFLLIGFAFMFVEISLIHRLILYLYHPVYATAVVLAAFLVFAGLGSGWANGFQRWLGPRLPGAATAPLRLLTAVIALVGLMTLVGMPILLREAMACPAPVRFSLAMMFTAPLAFLMGMPFPLALSRVGRFSPDFIPWAWGLNGWASVLGAVLAALLSVHAGFSGVFLLALAFYVAAGWLWPAAAEERVTG